MFPSCPGRVPGAGCRRDETWQRDNVRGIKSGDVRLAARAGNEGPRSLKAPRCKDHKGQVAWRHYWLMIFCISNFTITYHGLTSVYHSLLILIRFQPEEDPSRSLLCNCETSNFANIRFQLYCYPTCCPNLTLHSQVQTIGGSRGSGGLKWRPAHRHSGQRQEAGIRIFVKCRWNYFCCIHSWY